MGYPIEVTALEPQPAAVVRDQVTVDALPGFLGGAFGEVMQVLAQQGITPVGPPFARYAARDGRFHVAAGFPVSRPIGPAGRVEAAVLPGGDVASVIYRGPYSGVGTAYEAVQEWLRQNGYKVSGEPWESYLDGPEVAEPRTIVQFPCTPKAAGR